MSETVILGIQPTFYLKKIDPLSIPSKILGGEYKNVSLESVQAWKKSTKDTSHQQVSVIGTNQQDKMFTYSDRNNNIFTCVTTNNFSPNGATCQWCRLSFQNSWVGIPYRLEQTQTKDYYYTEGCYCCFECAAAEVNLISKRVHILHSGLLTSSNILLETMFKSVYPDKTLICSPDFRLHERNGGALSDKDFYENKSLFLETSGIVIVPYKKIFVKI
jgi:hypothetical protein